MRTYSGLHTGRRVPTEYEVVSTDLHYDYPLRFELADGEPVVRWYEQHREGSPLYVSTWDAFSDPRRTTYRAYTNLQDGQEQVVDALFDEIDETGYDENLTDGWVSFLENNYFPLRFPLHGLEMIAAYVGQMAPSSRLTNCATFQAGDELRALQRIAYRTVQMESHRQGHDAREHRITWEEAPHYQPLRQLIERALVCYDWAEALVVLNVVIKPRLDRWINHELAGHLAYANADPILRSIHFSLGRDSEWHRQWTEVAIRTAVADNPTNRELIGRWISDWQPIADASLDSLARSAAHAPTPLDPRQILGRILQRVDRDVKATLGSEPPG
jgi:hypothetical protein